MDGNKNRSILQTSKCGVHMAYAHARLDKASDLPAQHDVEAIAEWDKGYPAPAMVRTRRLW